MTAEVSGPACRLPGLSFLPRPGGPPLKEHALPKEASSSIHTVLWEKEQTLSLIDSSGHIWP